MVNRRLTSGILSGTDAIGSRSSVIQDIFTFPRLLYQHLYPVQLRPVVPSVQISSVSSPTQSAPLLVLSSLRPPAQGHHIFYKLSNHIDRNQSNTWIFPPISLQTIMTTTAVAVYCGASPGRQKAYQHAADCMSAPLI